MKIRHNVGVTQTIKVRNTLSPRTIQMLKSFRVPYNELINAIQKEAEDNVCLEVTRFDDIPSSPLHSSLHADTDIESIADSNNRGSLWSFLYEQLELERLKEREKNIISDLIDLIDDNGYITAYETNKLTLCKKHNISERKLFDMLKILQTFEPEGVGARNLKECLLLQLYANPFEHEALQQVMEKAIKHHLDDIAENNTSELARGLGIPEQGVSSILDYLKTLNPEPGLAFKKQVDITSVVPSLKLALDENLQPSVTNLEQANGIQVSVSPYYQQKLADPNIDKETKTFLEKKYNQAKAYVDMIEARQKNLTAIGQYLATYQLNFLKHGVFNMKPLTQAALAKNLDISISTISRMLSSKFIDTPHGILPLKALCPRGHKGYTAIQIQKQIIAIIKENPALTDEGIQAILKEQKLDIARRTVAKYRKNAGLDSSHSRPGS